MSTTAQDRKRVVERFIEEVWHDSNLDALDELFTADHEVVGVPTARETADMEGHREFIATMLEAFPDVHYEYDTDEIIADETGVAAAWTATGTHEGELMGIEPTGKEVSARGVMLAHFEDDKIERIEVVYDELGMLQQLGVDPDELAE